MNVTFFLTCKCQQWCWTFGTGSGRLPVHTATGFDPLQCPAQCVAFTWFIFSSCFFSRFKKQPHSFTFSVYFICQFTINLHASETRILSPRMFTVCTPYSYQAALLINSYCAHLEGKKICPVPEILVIVGPRPKKNSFLSISCISKIYN